MTTPISLRPLRVDDADEMARVLADPGLYTFTGGEPPTAEALAEQYGFQARGWSPDRSERWINDLIVLDSTGEAVGYVQATVPQDGGPAEVAWVVGAPLAGPWLRDDGCSPPPGTPRRPGRARGDRAHPPGPRRVERRGATLRDAADRPGRGRRGALGGSGGRRRLRASGGG